MDEAAFRADREEELQGAAQNEGLAQAAVGTGSVSVVCRWLGPSP